MRHYVASLVPTVLVGGCSLIYNPSNIDKPRADATDAPMIDVIPEIDARIDAAPILDADPGMLAITGVAPSVILEGRGVGGSRKAIVVLEGAHIIDGFDVTISPSTNLTIDSKTRSANGNYIALEITTNIVTTAPVDVPLTITVTQPGAPDPVVVAGALTLRELPELTNTNLPLDLTVVNAQLYSQVALTGTVTFTGNVDQRMTLHAVSSIQIGTIDAKGGAANGTTGGAAGRPFGCPGGNEASNGGCNVGGGGGAAAAGGGGGGGFTTTGGSAGGGLNAGLPGVAHGEPQLARYDGTDVNGLQLNRSSGGGGGSTTSSMFGDGGGGGGGGGSIELSAGGNIAVTSVDVSGGPGDDGAGVLNTAPAGGGGGGSGGVIVVRSQNGTITGTFAANGGAKGMGDAGGSDGGAGSVGRIRWDSPVTAPTGIARRGLVFAASTPAIVTDVNANISVLGTDGDIFDAYLIDAAGMDREGEPKDQVVAAGMKMFQAAFVPGYQQLCATLRPGSRHTDLGDACVEIAYLP